jgi:hypothetical protein
MRRIQYCTKRNQIKLEKSKFADIGPAITPSPFKGIVGASSNVLGKNKPLFKLKYLL